MRWAEKHPEMHNISSLETDGLQTQTTTSGSTPLSQEQKSEAAAGTGSSKLDSCRLEKDSLVWWISISAEEADGRLRIWCQQRESIVNSSGCWWWWYNGMGSVILAQFRPLDTNQMINVWMLESEYSCSPFTSVYGHNLPFSNCYFQHNNAPFLRAKVISD